MTDQIPASIHESIKQDFKIELSEVDIQNKLYRTFIADIAKDIGCVQETEAIKARVHTLIEKESKLQSIVDNRPLTRHPFEGLGQNLIKLSENSNKALKLLIKNLKHGTN
jgi:hypothetical protein